MRYYILTCCYILSSFVSIAQTKISDDVKMIVSLPDPNILTATAVDISDYRILDSTLFKVTYQFSYRQGIQNLPKTEWMYLDIGSQYIKFYSDNYYRMDSLYSYRYKDMIPIYTRDRHPCEELLFEIKTKQLSVFNRTVNGPAVLISYKEPIPQIKWSIFDNMSKKISGYTCYKAQSEFGGRNWTVWFTPDIPLAYGPWKLGYLPGLILEAFETNNGYSFECISIKKQSFPIKQANCKYQKTTKKAWKQYEFKLHQSPISLLNPEGSILYYHHNKKLDEFWTIPYNPIELE